MLRCDAVLLAAVLFLVLTVASMVLYPGSTDHDHSTTHYSFTDNFFSDLGATRTYADQGNLASSVFFTLALTLVGLALVFFGLTFRVILSMGQRMGSVGVASAIACAIAGLAFIGIAAFPENVSETMHIFFVKVAFGSLLVYVVLVTVLQVANGWAHLYVGLNVVYLVLLAGYVGLLFFGPGLETVSGLRVQAIGQKVIVYSSMIDLAFQAYGIRLYLLVNSGGEKSAAG